MGSWLWTRYYRTKEESQRLFSKLGYIHEIWRFNAWTNIVHFSVSSFYFFIQKHVVAFHSREVISHEGYKDSPLISMIESDLIKSETIESNLDENLEKIIVGDIEVKLD